MELALDLVCFVQHLLSSGCRVMQLRTGSTVMRNEQNAIHSRHLLIWASLSHSWSTEYTSLLELDRAGKEQDPGQCPVVASHSLTLTTGHAHRK